MNGQHKQRHVVLLLLEVIQVIQEEKITFVVFMEVVVAHVARDI
jgi:hypothetical protein